MEYLLLVKRIFMHFKRNLWLSITGATIVIIAVLFGSKQSEANSGIKHNLPQINIFKTQREFSQHKELNAQSSYSND
ncbi:MAG: hypothetical protein ACI9UD_001381 [Glaciecola sp.]|jgi:hypothetical protein